MSVFENHTGKIHFLQTIFDSAKLYQGNVQFLDIPGEPIIEALI